uniref:Uncharacterized protein n=1 Tax=Coccidioides posadasii RMSCC 3488 TaxID=454284 RepID=A0A0J6F9I8_COCPO|nr:hypothetical protein CPAG_03219 [Coccidioides posadasii RMSCC 3488]
MILCLMLRFAFLHLSRWLHHSIGIWGHNQKTALLIPLQQRLDILHKTTKPPPSALFAFHFFAGRSPPRADGCGGPNKLVDWLNDASSPLPRAREKRNKKDDDGRLGTIPPKRTQSDFPQDPVNASLRTWKHSRPEQLLLTRLSGCDSAFPTSPKGVGWILVFEEEKSQPNKTVPGFPSVFSRRRIYKQHEWPPLSLCHFGFRFGDKVAWRLPGSTTRDPAFASQSPKACMYKQKSSPVPIAASSDSPSSLP